MTDAEFVNLTEVFLPRLLRSAKWRWGDEGEDFIQEAFLRAYEQRAIFNHSVTFATWVFSIAINFANNSRRGRLDIATDVDILKVVDNITPEDYAIGNEMLDIFSKLPEKQRDAVFDRLFSDEHDRKNLWWAKQVLAKSLGVKDE
jgi:DNA-directed RNA polymerase specialized sigma24 family protein